MVIKQFHKGRFLIKIVFGRLSLKDNDFEGES